MRRTLVIMGALAALTAAPAAAATRGCEVERGAQKGAQAIVALDRHQILTDRDALYRAEHAADPTFDQLRHLQKTVAVFNERALEAARARYAARCQKGGTKPFCVQLKHEIAVIEARQLANQKQIDRLRTRIAELQAGLLPLEQRLDNDRAQLVVDLAKLSDAAAAYRACEGV